MKRKLPVTGVESTDKVKGLNEVSSFKPILRTLLGHRMTKRPFGHIRIAMPPTSLHANASDQDVSY